MRNTMTGKIGMALGTVLLAAAVAAGQENVTVGFGSVKLNGLLQGWYQHDEGADPKGTFRLRRAEVKLSGEVTPEVTWWLMFDPATVREDDARTAGIDEENFVTSVGRKSILQDFAIRLKPHETLALDIGQYKIPFGMEGLRSSARLDFIDRAAVATRFQWADARDIGATLYGDFRLGDVNVQPAIGVYNGEGQNRLDANDHQMIVARLAVSPVNGLHLGMAHVNNKAGADEVKSEHTGFEAKYATDRFSVYGEYAFGESEGRDRETYYVAATYSVMDDLQLAARFDRFDPDTDQAGNAGTETTLGINYFIARHNAKMQLNYVFRGEQGASIDNDVVRAALQVSF